MSIRDRFNNSKAQRNFGLMALVLGTTTKLFLHPTAFIVPGVFDGIVGFFYGAAIGALLLSLRRGQSECTSLEA